MLQHSALLASVGRESSENLQMVQDDEWIKSAAGLLVHLPFEVAETFEIKHLKNDFIKKN